MDVAKTFTHRVWDDSSYVKTSAGIDSAILRRPERRIRRRKKNKLRSLLSLDLKPPTAGAGE
jgi:hypothetical protein